MNVALTRRCPLCQEVNPGTGTICFRCGGDLSARVAKDWYQVAVGVALGTVPLVPLSISFVSQHIPRASDSIALAGLLAAIGVATSLALCRAGRPWVPFGVTGLLLHTIAAGYTLRLLLLSIPMH